MEDIIHLHTAERSEQVQKSMLGAGKGNSFI